MSAAYTPLAEIDPTLALNITLGFHCSKKQLVKIVPVLFHFLISLFLYIKLYSEEVFYSQSLSLKNYIFVHQPPYISEVPRYRTQECIHV